MNLEKVHQLRSHFVLTFVRPSVRNWIYLAAIEDIRLIFSPYKYTS